MSNSPTPIPLLCIGRTRELAILQGQSLAPNFSYAAIIDQPHYCVENVHILLETLNPSPAGIVVGGGLSVEVQQEVTAIVADKNEKAGYGPQLKLVCIPIGIREKHGAEGLMKWLKDVLSETYGVAW
jgi:hypothetical protein